MELMHVTLVLSLCLFSVASADTEFSTSAISSPPVPAASVSTPARSDIECAVKCSSAGLARCAANVYLPESQICLMSAANDADFKAEAPLQRVFRRLSSGASWSLGNAGLVMIGDRRFRIIMHRSKGVLSFAQTWTEYENGFGDGTDYWIGLRTINELTGRTPRVLRVEAVTWSAELFIAEYSEFTVANAGTNYTMTFGSYLTDSSNMTGDALAYQKGCQFSTKDRDNDNRSGSSCSVAHCGSGGWWYSSCAYCNPSGVYQTSGVADGLNNMNWRYATGGTYAALKSIQLMVEV